MSITFLNYIFFQIIFCQNYNFCQNYYFLSITFVFKLRFCSNYIFVWITMSVQITFFVNYIFVQLQFKYHFTQSFLTRTLSLHFYFFSILGKIFNALEMILAMRWLLEYLPCSCWWQPSFWWLVTKLLDTLINLLKDQFWLKFLEQ